MPPSRALSFCLLASTGALLMMATEAGRADEPVGSSVRFNREVVRILERKCVACHAAEDGLAMPLVTYFDVRPWARPIREEILERRMPPWPAARGVQPLANELSLTIREMAVLVSWIDGGMPRGEPGDLPVKGERPEWPAGPPDQTVTLPPQSIVLDDTPVSRRVPVPFTVAKSGWLRGFDVRAGATSALRSAFLYARDARGAERWLGGWTPWHAMAAAPAGLAHRLDPGDTLTLQLHYQGWDERGGTVADQSTVGLYLSAAPPRAEVGHVRIASAPVRGGDAPDARGDLPLATDAVIWALLPQMRQAGAPAAGSIEVRASRPDGSTEPLLWVKDYSPAWQLPYVLRDPVALPRGTRLTFTAAATGGLSEADVSVLWYAPPTTPEGSESSAQR